MQEKKNSFKNFILKDCLKNVCFKNPYKGCNKVVQIEMEMKKWTEWSVTY